jgi:hypothetical protein
VSARLAGSPFSMNLLIALAIEATFPLWGALLQRMPTAGILELCIADTIDALARLVFPKNTDLLAAARGDEMFKVSQCRTG